MAICRNLQKYARKTGRVLDQFSTRLRKTLIGTLVFGLIVYLSLVFCPKVALIPNRIYYSLYPKNSISCYRFKEKSLLDISDVEVRKGKSIFFHETSCNSYQSGKIVITARQACAVESAAKLNPNFDVYLLFTSPGVLVFNNTESDRILQNLLSYSNVKILHLDYDKYTKGTPLEDVYQSGRLEFSNYALSHASDVLRYLTLWKYGGIYLDLDVVIIKSLEKLPPNYAGIESEKSVAAGVLSFSPTGVGLKHIQTCIKDLRDNFNGRDWGSNGPGVITRFLRKVCGVQMAKDMVNRECEGFRAYPTEYFYPVVWWNWTVYFDKNQMSTVNEAVKNSYAIHVWNKYSVNRKIKVGSIVPYGQFAKKYCPLVYNECDTYF